MENSLEVFALSRFWLKFLSYCRLAFEPKQINISAANHLLFENKRQFWAPFQLHSFKFLRFRLFKQVAWDRVQMRFHIRETNNLAIKTYRLWVETL